MNMQEEAGLTYHLIGALSLVGAVVLPLAVMEPGSVGQYLGMHLMWFVGVAICPLTWLAAFVIDRAVFKARRDARARDALSRTSTVVVVQDQD